MSNVLIGIIGVILFIGLALAGALFLGQRFQDATLNSKAAAVMTGIKQIADAVEMRKLQEGKNLIKSGQVDFLVGEGYLKAVPKSPSNAAIAAPTEYRWKMVLNNNIYADVDEAFEIYAAKYVVLPLGRDNDRNAVDTCRIIAKTYGDPDILGYENTIDPPRPAGCIAVEGSVIAYQRIAPTSQSSAQALP
jgi:hypothetical protein